MNELLRTQLAQLVEKHQVVLFMKGTRKMPQCGFSAAAVQILDATVGAYETVDVLASSEIRSGIKEFSDWPTIPQLFIDGKFVGGSDILRAMHESGELLALLGAKAPGTAPIAPTLSVTAAALQAFAAALAEGAPEEGLHLKIDATFQNELFFGPREVDDLEVQVSGLTILLDRASARRANGVNIDFVTGPGSGFKIDNPNAPPSVRQISARDLKARLDRGEVVLFDVRPEGERQIASIAAARSLDAQGREYLFSLDRGTPIALHCHHGVRSYQAAQQLLLEGFRQVYNLQGGIEEWSQTVDSKVPHY